MINRIVLLLIWAIYFLEGAADMELNTRRCDIAKVETDEDGKKCTKTVTLLSNGSISQQIVVEVDISDIDEPPVWAKSYVHRREDDCTLTADGIRKMKKESTCTYNEYCVDLVGVKRLDDNMKVILKDVGLTLLDDPLISCRTLIGNNGSCIAKIYCPDVFIHFPRDLASKTLTALKNACHNEVTDDGFPMFCCRNANFREETVEPVSIETPAPTESPKINDDRGSEKPCFDLQNEIGFCKPLRNCTELFDALKANPSNDTLKDFLRHSHRKCDSTGNDVCCSITFKGKSSPKNDFDKSFAMPLTEDEGCGRDHHGFMKKVIGGQESEIGSWPWIALLGYNPYSMNTFRCGGTLITARHVLTAAHCILFDLSFVRLGEHDVRIEDESTHIDVNIVKVIKHENYSNVQIRFDIALLFLERSVEFTDVIYPVCLPMSDEMRAKSFVAYQPYIAGWGRTSREDGLRSDTLQEAQLLVQENHVCRDAFRLMLRAKGRQFPEINVDDSVLCVGDLSGTKDTCRGDSGGPLLISASFKGTSRYYLIGSTSFGVGCARPGVPAIYSSTQYFMDWILEKLKVLQT